MNDFGRLLLGDTERSSSDAIERSCRAKQASGSSGRPAKGSVRAPPRRRSLPGAWIHAKGSVVGQDQEPVALRTCSETAP